VRERVSESEREREREREGTKDSKARLFYTPNQRKLQSGIVGLFWLTKKMLTIYGRELLIFLYVALVSCKPIASLAMLVRQTFCMITGHKKKLTTPGHKRLTTFHLPLKFRLGIQK
jgi:hypothetical protein